MIQDRSPGRSASEQFPEPVDTSSDPAPGAQREAALEMALLLVMETLNPTERAAYVLREAFEYEYAEIADILRLGQANVRKIVSRARKRLCDSGFLLTIAASPEGVHTVMWVLAPGKIAAFFDAHPRCSANRRPSHTTLKQRPNLDDSSRHI